MPPKAPENDEPREFRATAVGVACAVTSATGEGEGKKDGTFTGNAYTGAVMRPQGWWGPIVIDLAGVKVPDQQRPVLRQHDHEQIVGHTTEVKVEADGIKVAGILSGEDQHVVKVTKPASKGFKWQLSIGATPIRTEYLEAGEETEVNGNTVVGPLTISRETELGEVSFVPLGADGATSADVSAAKGRPAVNDRILLKAMKQHGHVLATKYSDDQIDKMSDDEAKAALKKCMKGEEEKKPEAEDEDVDAEDDEDVDAEDDEPKASKSAKGGPAIKATGGKAKAIAASRKAAADEERRVGRIRACLRKFPGAEQVKLKNGSTVDLVPHAIEAGWSVEKTERTAELHVLRASRPGPGVGMGGAGPHVYSTSNPEATEAVLEAAVLHAARHQFALADDEFYTDPTPDGRGTVRRVPMYLQKEVQAQLATRYTDQVQQYAHTMFKGRITPHQIIHAAFSAWGHRRELDLSGEQGIRSMLKAWDHYDGGMIRADGASNLSISNILSNVQNKFALQGYLFTEQAWREVCAIRNVKDFKPTTSLNLLGDVMYKQVGSTGELENASLGDQAFANQAKNFGRIMTIPWTHLVNDDLGMLTGVPVKIGQGAGLALNDQIWTLWKNMMAGTVNGDDGNPFFRTTSDVTAAAKKAGKAYLPNKLTGGGSAFGDAGLKAAMALFWNQIDPNGNPLGFDGLQPVLLHGPTLWRDVTAQAQAPAIVYGGASAGNAPNANPWQGKYKPVMSRYIENASYGNTATGWSLLFNPIALAVIEVCFLNGVDTPAVLQAGPDYQFDRLGISIRGTMPFGSNQQNFRGGVYAVGA